MSDSEAYWDGNLDAGNIEREHDGAVDYPMERAFFLAPEGAYALSELSPDGDLEGLRIIDLGAGLGVASMIMAERGARVVAVDSAPNRLKALKRLASDLGVAGAVEILEASAERLPLPDASVDAVFTKSVMIHTDLPVALAEVHRVLKPGGRAVFLEPLARNPLAMFYRRFLGPPAWREITTYFDAPSIAAVKKEFKTVHERRFHILGFAAFVFQFALRWPRAFRLAVALSNVVDAMLMTLLRPLRGLSWFTVLTCRKND